MRIGELLLLRESVDPWVLTNVLNTQVAARQRVVSLLVSRALLDCDEGAMLLSEQLGYPAAMQRHLERRDHSLESIIPAELGARWVVLPLGRSRTGDLVVLARDPTPILVGALAHATRESVVLAVTPSIQIERLVRMVYGAPGEPDAPLEATPPTLADIGALDFDPTTWRPARRRTVSDMYLASGSPDLPASRPTPAPPTPTDRALDEIDSAPTMAGAERRALEYAAVRWPAAILFKLVDGYSVGQRGHGARLGAVDKIEISLRQHSSLRIAHDTRGVTTARPRSDVQDRLVESLGDGLAVVTAPIIVSGEVVALLVIGHAPENQHATLADIDRLGDALTAAHHRFAR